MRKIVIFLALVCTKSMATAQDDIYPAKDYKGLLFITNGTVHTGNGQVLENTTIEINNGRIVRLGQNISLPVDDVKVFNAAGKHVYPGLILSQSDIGLKEIGSGVRGSNDFRELGDLNPNVRSIVAYNSASAMINVLRSNGILLVNTVSQGGTISGSSTVVQLDAWNWEDAAYKTDGAIHINIPSVTPRSARANCRTIPGRSF